MKFLRQAAIYLIAGLVALIAWPLMKSVSGLLTAGDGLGWLEKWVEKVLRR